VQRLALLNIVALSDSLISRENTPRIFAYREAHESASFPPVQAALTTSAQSSITTGLPIAQHGIVANGWYDRTDAEVKFWKQSNHLVQGEKIWDKLKKDNPAFTCAKLFWWYNMYSTADYTITPRPLYPADGRKVFDIYTQPMELREDIKADLGDFPFPAFWGPRASIPSSEWIALSAQWIENKYSPSLSLVYLPHLDYPLQKVGPTGESIPEELKRIDQVVGELLDFYATQNISVILHSEYGISEAHTPIHLNRLLRQHDHLTIKDELGHDTLDCGASEAFAIADHQIAHLYLNDPSLLSEIRALLEKQPGIHSIQTPEEAYGDNLSPLTKERAGDLILTAKQGHWFTYYFWKEVQDHKAPDYARSIDIHRKPGYDPAELFINPKLKLPAAKIATFLAKKKLGFRTLMDVIPLDASLVKGTHGSPHCPPEHYPLVIGPHVSSISKTTDLHQHILTYFQQDS